MHACSPDNNMIPCFFMFLLYLILLYVVKKAKPVITSKFYVLWHHESLWKPGLLNTFANPWAAEIRLHSSWLFHIYTNSLPPRKEFQGVVHKALQTKSSSDRCFMFLHAFLRKATQSWKLMQAATSLGFLQTHVWLCEKALDHSHWKIQ